MKYDITPVPAPRQVNSDKWKPRPMVLRYRAFRDEVRLKRVAVPCAGARIVFRLPMPKSWKAEKKNRMRYTAHKQKPDLDNLLKALLDSVFRDDAHIWDYRAQKLWDDEGSIEIMS